MKQTIIILLILFCVLLAFAPEIFYYANKIILGCLVFIGLISLSTYSNKASNTVHLPNKSQVLYSNKPIETLFIEESDVFNISDVTTTANGDDVIFEAKCSSARIVTFRLSYMEDVIEAVGENQGMYQIKKGTLYLSRMDGKYELLFDPNKS